MVKKYVHSYKGKYASGNLTGAAFDIRLWRNGRKIPMCNLKLNFGKNAKSKQNKLAPYLLINRKLMFKVLEKVGFVNYPKEFWHW